MRRDLATFYDFIEQRFGYYCLRSKLDPMNILYYGPEFVF